MQIFLKKLRTPVYIYYRTIRTEYIERFSAECVMYCPKNRTIEKTSNNSDVSIGDTERRTGGRQQTGQNLTSKGV